MYLKCGCRIYMSDHPNLLVPLVEFCPMHKAAPDLLEALKKVQFGLGECPICFNNQFDGHEVDCEIFIVLAKARCEDG